MTLLFLYRRPEGNPLDLNNLPDEYSRDGKQILEDSSSPGKPSFLLFIISDHAIYTVKYQSNIKTVLFSVSYFTVTHTMEGFHFS